MNYINITVRGKIARAEGRARVVCGNSDYAVRFDFDAEWAEYTVKTARFVTEDGSYTDVQFEGDTCAVPILRNTRTLLVGVFAGNLRTTTAALIHAVPCITDPDGTPSAPGTAAAGESTDYARADHVHPKELPECSDADAGKVLTVAGNADVQWQLPSAGADTSLGMTGATVGQIAKITAVDDSGKPTAWEAVDMPSGREDLYTAGDGIKIEDGKISIDLTAWSGGSY